MPQIGQCSYARMPEDQLSEQEAHENFMKRRVHVSQQSRFQLQVWLRPCKQILHDLAKLRAPFHEPDHPRRNRCEEQRTAEEPLRKPCPVSQVHPEIARDELAVAIRM